jgi:hypothetical protein
MTKDELVHLLQVAFSVIAFAMGYVLGKISG